MITGTSKGKRSYINIILGVLAAVCFSILISNGSVVTKAVAEGLRAAFLTVMPSTFPYMVLSSVMISSGVFEKTGRIFSPLAKLFDLPDGCMFVIPMSLVCGFPVGAAAVGRLYAEGRCSREEGERLAAFCNFCGPPYILGVFASAVESYRGAVIAYITQSILALIFGIVLAKTGGRKRKEDEKEPRVSGGADGINKEGLSSVICHAVCTSGYKYMNTVFYIVFFSVICSAAGKMLPFLPRPLLGFLELTYGISGLNTIKNKVARYFFGCAIIYFSGASVHFQVISILEKPLSAGKYMITRIIFFPVCSALATFAALILGAL